MDPHGKVRRLHLPPEGRPYWKAPPSDGGDLLYLCWGLRWYGDHPIPLSCRDGWTYFVVLDGAPVFVFEDGSTLVARAGTGLIFHPDCVRGARDAKGRRSQILGWIWRTPPAHESLRPRPGGHGTTTFGKELLRRVEKVHADCRRQAFERGPWSGLELAKDRLELDLCFLHSRDRAGPARQEYRLERAVRFVRDHPEVLDPTRRLCEHMQVSSATLKRLFRAGLGQSPRAFAYEQRMLRAARMLSSGRKMMKEAAFELGYAHPGDFSRAFHRYLERGRRSVHAGREP